MEAKVILINLLKVCVLTLVTLVFINLIGFLFDVYKLYKNGESIESFEYSNFNFLLNGNQTYNQFKGKYAVFNILIFLFYFFYAFKDYLKIIFNKFLLLFIFFPIALFSQQNGITDFDRGLKIGEILVNGLTVFKGGKANASSNNTSTKSQFCVKNKLPEKIQFKLERIDKEDTENVIKKELVIPPNGKECLFEIDKQIWNYEIFLIIKKEIHKKGELKVDDDITISVNE